MSSYTNIRTYYKEDGTSCTVRAKGYPKALDATDCLLECKDLDGNVTDTLELPNVLLTSALDCADNWALGIWEEVFDGQ